MAAALPAGPCPGPAVSQSLAGRWSRSAASDCSGTARGSSATSCFDWTGSPPTPTTTPGFTFASPTPPETLPPPTAAATKYRSTRPEPPTAPKSTAPEQSTDYRHPTSPPRTRQGQWNSYEISVVGQQYTV